jgi:very-short-patch-repair endonuclease
MTVSDSSTPAPADDLSRAAVEALSRLGGVASRRQLLGEIRREQLEDAVHFGGIVRDARGRYALKSADEALRAVSRLRATLSHLSAAQAHGWQVKTPPEQPHLTFSEHRKLTKRQRRDVVVHRAELSADDVVDGGVTSIERTLVDCLRSLPFDEALAVADSALRARSLSAAHLIASADKVRGPGARQVRRVAALASPKAANPFESVLRALAIEAGLQVEPQVRIGDSEFLGRPDLVDVGLGIVLEADSFEWHGKRDALRNDARRYDQLVAGGWVVLRFAWEDVMHDQAWVRKILTATADERRKGLVCARCGA